MSYSDAIRDSDLTTDELETAFESLKGNKASGIDTINSIMIFWNMIFIFSIFKHGIYKHLKKSACYLINNLGFN